jgi:hypothetical protein
MEHKDYEERQDFTFKKIPKEISQDRPDGGYKTKKGA